MLSISSSFAPNFNQPEKGNLKPKPKNNKRNYIFPKFSLNNYFSLSNLLKPIDDFVSDFVDLPLSPYLDPKQVLSDSFAPVNEFPPTACEVVEGSLPSCLDGAYIRNGPNPQFIPDRGPYHLFDGDGMLHMIRISGGQAMFCSRYVRTYKYGIEQKIGYPVFPSVFSSFNSLGSSLVRCGLILARIFTGQFDPMANGFGTANTSLALISGRLFALGDSDLPYEIKVTSEGDLVTLDRHNFFENITPFLNMNPHPKTDLDTKETFSLRFSVVPPRLKFLRIDPDGRKKNELPIFSMNNTSMTHDFGLTKNFIVFPDVKIVLDLMEITRGRSPVRVDKDKTPRLGVVPRYAVDERRLAWIETPGLNILHCCNAWEEDDGETVVIVATIISALENEVEMLDSGLNMEKITVNVRDKTLKRIPLSDKLLDMGVINPAYAGKKNRYVYATIIAEPILAVGVVKIDLSSPVNSSDHVVACHQYRPGCYGGETFFVPREHNNPAAEEDDGYLLMLLHDRNSEESMFLVLDAQSPTLETVCTIKLPGRVPAGFHGLFLRETDITNLSNQHCTSM